MNEELKPTPEQEEAFYSIADITERQEILPFLVARDARLLAPWVNAFNSGWHSCADVPPYDHPDSCGKCLGCLVESPGAGFAR